MMGLIARWAWGAVLACAASVAACEAPVETPPAAAPATTARGAGAGSSKPVQAPAANAQSVVLPTLEQWGTAPDSSSARSQGLLFAVDASDSGGTARREPLMTSVRWIRELCGQLGVRRCSATTVQPKSDGARQVVDLPVEGVVDPDKQWRKAIDKVDRQHTQVAAVVEAWLDRSLGEAADTKVMVVWFDGVVNDAAGDNVTLPSARLREIGGAWLVAGRLPSATRQSVWMLVLALPGAIEYGREVAAVVSKTPCPLPKSACLEFAGPAIELAPGRGRAMSLAWKGSGRTAADGKPMVEKPIGRRWGRSGGAAPDYQGSTPGPAVLVAAPPPDYWPLPTLGPIDKADAWRSQVGDLVLNLSVLGEFPAAVARGELRWQASPWRTVGSPSAGEWYAGLLRKVPEVAEMVRTVPLLGSCRPKDEVGSVEIRCVAQDLRPCAYPGVTPANAAKTEEFCKSQRATALGQLLERAQIRALNAADSDPRLWLERLPGCSLTPFGPVDLPIAATVSMVRGSVGSACPRRFTKGDTGSTRSLMAKLRELGPSCRSSLLEFVEHIADGPVGARMAREKTTYYENGETGVVSRLYAVNTAMRLAHDLADATWPMEVEAVRLIWLPHQRQTGSRPACPN